MLNKIDMVILWVDGNDRKWQIEKEKYGDKKNNSRDFRYRDWESLIFLFRGIEKYASWVNKIYFVTWGHIPHWLNTENDKIIIVKHEDFIPREYLPTFNSNVIELNLHRIKGLSEQFIILNDDFLILKDIRPEDFFINGNPRGTFYEKMHLPHEYKDTYYMMLANILYVINKHFKKNEVYKKNLDKYINEKYKELNEYTKYSMKIKSNFVGFGVFHKPYPYLKSTFTSIWQKEEKTLNEACKNKFRGFGDLGHLLCGYWQMLTGNFEPIENESITLNVKNNILEIIEVIKNKDYKFVCINDVSTDIDFERIKKQINTVLQEIFPQKSMFEL